MKLDTLFRTSRGGRFLVLLTILALPFVLSSCDSQLEQETFGQIGQGAFPANAEEFRSSAAAAYAPLRDIQFDPFNLSEHSSDQTLVPTRGGDWADGGIWRELHQHTWDQTHPRLGGVWGPMNTGISRTNSVLSSVAAAEALSEEQKASFEAEMTFLRAYYYYWLMDMFGGVPIVVEPGSDGDFPTQAEISTDNPPPHNSRKEVFDFILQELVGATSDNISVSDITDPASESALANIPEAPDTEYGRGTRGAAYALLARMLLNAEVFAVPVGGPNGQGIDAVGNGPALYEEAVAAAEQVLNSPHYSLMDDYYDNFAADNAGANEIIFAATYKAKSGQGFNREQPVLHYNHTWKVGGWNGFSTIADFYNSFDNVPGNETRKNQFLEGRQYSQPGEGCHGDNCFSDESSEPLLTRDGETPLNLQAEIPSLIIDSPNEPELENPGLRPLKFELDPNASQWFMGNDLPLFRLAEMYLIKAEALTAMGQVNAAKGPFNTVRTRTGADPVTGTPSESEMYQLILQERGFEFHFEMLRRQDQIRYEFAHGQSRSEEPYAPSFTGPWTFKEPSDDKRALFPIPENQLSVNPNLQQNPGY